MNLHKQNFVCWPSVGPQDIKQTYMQFQIGKARQIWSFCATRERFSSRIRVRSITIYVVMPDKPERAPLQELQVPQGVNLADPAGSWPASAAFARSECC